MVIVLGSVFIWLGVTARKWSAAASGAPHSGDAVSSQELKVRDWIIDHSHDPKSLEFVSWGPHDLKGELHALAEKRSKAKAAAGQLVFADPLEDLLVQTDKVFRVRYRGKNGLGGMQLADTLVFVRERDGPIDVNFGPFPLAHGTMVASLNEYDDDWLEMMRKRLSPP